LVHFELAVSETVDDVLHVLPITEDRKADNEIQY